MVAVAVSSEDVQVVSDVVVTLWANVLFVQPYGIFYLALLKYFSSRCILLGSQSENTFDRLIQISGPRHETLISIIPNPRPSLTALTPRVLRVLSLRNLMNFLPAASWTTEPRLSGSVAVNRYFCAISVSTSNVFTGNSSIYHV